MIMMMKITEERDKRTDILANGKIRKSTNCKM